MTDVRVRELLESTLDSAPPARFDLDSAMRSGRRRRRARTAAVLGSSALALVLAGSLVVSVVPRAGTGPTPTGPVASSPTVSLPRGVVGTGPLAYAVPLEPSRARGQQTTAAPTLEVWIDPQCPACSAFHRITAATIRALVDDGAVTVLYRPATFLDDAVADENTAAGAPRSSRRALAAWGCAIDLGRGSEYLDALMDGQPATEGVGFDDARLDELARSRGITGEDLVRFTECRTSGRYLAWADAAQRTFADSKVPGTPTVLLDGRELPTAVAADPAALRAAVLEAASGSR